MGIIFESSPLKGNWKIRTAADSKIPKCDSERMREWIVEVEF